MAQPLRTLLVGVGARGKVWARLLHEEPLTETVGYVDLMEANLQWARERYGAVPNVCFSELAPALRTLKPKLVVLATPPMDRLRRGARRFREWGAPAFREAAYARF